MLTVAVCEDTSVGVFPINAIEVPKLSYYSALLAVFKPESDAYLQMTMRTSQTAL